MARYISVFIKFFSSEEHREDFLSGDLYMNTIEFFRRYEDSKDSNVGDKYEALMSWLQPKDVIVKLELGDNEIELTSKDFASPLTISVNSLNHCNVFCLTCLHSHDIDLETIRDVETIERLKSYFVLSEKNKDLGLYAVIIQPGKFLERVRLKLNELVNSNAIISFADGMVNYYDEKSKSLALENPLDAIFHKQSNYAHQSEYRFCIFRENTSDEALIINIGDINDIAIPIDTKDLNSSFQINVT